MSTSPRRETAKIYQFPLKPRRSDPADCLATPRADSWLPPKSDFGGGWYHEAAMQDSQKDRKH